MQTPIDVLFHYQPNGQLKVKVSIPNTRGQGGGRVRRETTFPKEHLDGWRRYISGAEPTDYA